MKGTKNTNQVKVNRRGRRKGSYSNVRVPIKEVLTRVGENGFVILNSRFAEFLGIKGYKAIPGQSIFKA